MFYLCPLLLNFSHPEKLHRFTHICNAKIHWIIVAQYELLGMDLQAMSPSPACQRCCLVPGLSESHQLGFSKRRDKMISDDGSGTKIRVRYWITSVKQPRDFSQGRRSCGQQIGRAHV